MSFLNWYWPLALAFIALVLFAIPEFFALHYGGLSFSRFMSNTSRKWPLWVFLWGLLIGGLAVHILGWCVGCP